MSGTSHGRLASSFSSFTLNFGDSEVAVIPLGLVDSSAKVRSMLSPSMSMRYMYESIFSRWDMQIMKVCIK